MSKKKQTSTTGKPENMGSGSEKNVKGTKEVPVKEVVDDVEGTDEEKKEEADMLAVEKDLNELKEKYDKLSNDYLLSRADFENYRRRTLKEKADLIKSGGEDCLKQILPLVDDFERGLQAIGNSSDVNAVKQGMELIYNKFQTYLKQHGITEIPTDGEPFDTEYHEAVTTFPVDDPNKKGKIIDTVQKGYKMNDKVIRFAKVVVGE